MAATTAGSEGVARRSHARGLLLALVVVEIAYFACAGSNFLTIGNAAEIARASVEIGLLALALTAVILTGGIDLSVGSLLGLSAVLMGVGAGATSACPIGGGRARWPSRWASAAAR